MALTYVLIHRRQQIKNNEENILPNLNFLQFKEKIDSIHESVIRGNIREVRGHLDKRGWANARDHYGHSPLHKSVMANQQQIMEFVIKLYPDHLEDRDNVRIFVFTTKYTYTTYL